MTSDKPATIAIEDELTRLATRMRRRSLRTVEALHPDLDYTTYVYFLAICDAPEPVRGADLAEQLQVHKSTASRAVATLSRLGLVEQRPDPLDGRARLLVPDDAALAKLRAFRAELHTRLERMLGDWNPAEIEQFAVLFQRYNDVADVEFA